MTLAHRFRKDGKVVAEGRPVRKERRGAQKPASTTVASMRSCRVLVSVAAVAGSE